MELLNLKDSFSPDRDVRLPSTKSERVRDGLTVSF